MVPGFSVQGYGGSAPGGINSIGEPTQPDGSPHPTIAVNYRQTHPVL